jgi:tetratricopeptide (TPR) repeat protein
MTPDTSDLKVDIESPQSWARRLTITVPAERVNREKQAVARSYAKRLRLPGFRKGKVPPQMVIQRLGRDAVLQQALQVALPATSEEAKAHHLLGTVYQQQRKFDDAVREFRAALDVVPGMRDALFSLGWTYDLMGNKEEAIRLGRHAIELLPVAKDSIRGPYMVAHLAIIAAILLLDAKKHVAFALTVLVGVFAKETLLIVLALWIAVHAVGEWKQLRRLALLLPGLVAYLALTRLMPAEAVHAFYDPAFVLAGLLRVFDPSLYTRGFLFHAVLSQLPLLAAFLAWAWLRWRRGVFIPVNRGLWVFFALLLLGIAMDIGNNAARVAFMAFPAVALFQARVMRSVTVNSEQ